LTRDIMMASRGYDMTPTMYSPDGRIYQVEYAIETVKRGTLALGISTKEGVIMAVEEKPRTLQTKNITQKIFQVDHHIGVAAAGYIPDARVQVDGARFFSQGNKMTYDESVEIGTVAKYLADQAHQFTQYGGVRPNGVAMIIAGVDQKGESVYVTDPSGTYVQFSAIAIGAGSDDVNEFLEKYYNKDMSLDEAAALAIAAINLKADKKDDIDNVKMAKITSASKIFEKISEDDLKKYSQNIAKFSSE
jgi:proteasome alpha subunit